MPTPVVMYIWSGFSGLITVRCTSSSIPGITWNVRPASVLFRRPPCSTPTNRVSGSSGWKAMCLVWAMWGGAGNPQWDMSTDRRAGKLGPAAPEIVAAEEVRGLRPGKDAHAAGQSGAREAVDVVLREPVVSPLPAVAPVGAGEDRAVVRPGEDRAALRLDQEGVDVLVGQRPVRRRASPGRRHRAPCTPRLRSCRPAPAGRAQENDRSWVRRARGLWPWGASFSSWIAGSERTNSPVSPGVSRSAHRRVPGYYRASRQRLVRPASAVEAVSENLRRPSGRHRPPSARSGDRPRLEIAGRLRAPRG